MRRHSSGRKWSQTSPSTARYCCDLKKSLNRNYSRDHWIWGSHDGHWKRGCQTNWEKISLSSGQLHGVAVNGARSLGTSDCFCCLPRIRFHVHKVRACKRPWCPGMKSLKTMFYHLLCFRMMLEQASGKSTVMGEAGDGEFSWCWPLVHFEYHLPPICMLCKSPTGYLCHGFCSESLVH